jgi:hypothetical protein
MSCLAVSHLHRTSTDAVPVYDHGHLSLPLHSLYNLYTQLHEQHAKRLEAARIAMKDIRNFENSINPQRDQRTVLEREIGKLRTSTKPDTNTNKRIESLQAELDALIAPNSALAKAELQAITLKRRMLAESFSMQFDSMQELGEKLAIISSHGKALIQGWDISPNTVGKSDYVSGAKTAAVRSSVEDAISSWDIRRPLVSPPNISAGEHGVARAPSFHQSHAGELASLHSVEDPAAAHKEALDSYYAQPASPGPGQGSISTSTTHGYDQSAGQRPAGSEYAHSHGQEHNSHPVGGNSSFSTSDHTTGSGNPFVQQLNNAPVTQLPAPVTASSTGGSYHTSPDLHPTRSNNSGSSPISIPVDTSPMSSTLAPAPSLPTVAETGAPISGTGGPAKGVLRSPDSTPADVSAAQSKQEEARQELNRRFDEYSGHAGGNNSTASGSGSGVNPFEDQSDQDYQTNLEKEISQRAHRGGESLPAYSAPSAGSSSDKPTQ